MGEGLVTQRTLCRLKTLFKPGDKTCILVISTNLIEKLQLSNSQLAVVRICQIGRENSNEWIKKIINRASLEVGKIICCNQCYLDRGY